MRNREVYRRKESRKDNSSLLFSSFFPSHQFLLLFITFSTAEMSSPYTPTKTSSPFCPLFFLFLSPSFISSLPELPFSFFLFPSCLPHPPFTLLSSHCPHSFLWSSFAFALAPPLRSYDSPLAFMCSPLAVLCFVLYFPLVLLWLSSGSPLAFLWLSFGFPLVFFPLFLLRLPFGSLYISLMFFFCCSFG